MVRIICDSAADLEPSEYENLNVECIPLWVSFDGVEYRENEDLSKELFYEKLKTTKGFPKTSQASPYDVECLLRDAMDAGDECVFICLSSGFSGFYQSVRMIKEELEYDACYVIDSLTGTGGLRLLVEYAARLRDEGRSAGEIAEAIEAIKGRVIIYACMDTLEYLHRGGRLGGFAYRVGSVANVKPILFISHEGYCEIPAKSIGMRRGMDYMAKRLEEHPHDESHPLYVMYTGDRSNGVKFWERLNGLGYNIPPERIINVGAAIGAHVGPGACGLCYIEK
ncbi:MAG: DegV family protein [Oscillospiraceae bacterium]|nr:DegV family protein [Oscillospiraceae bacterium]